MIFTRTYIALGALLFASLGTTALGADNGHLPLWRIDGTENRVYLLGSVHLLRESDYPIPPSIYDAYDDAETLVMELDMDDLDMLAVQALVSELGIIQNGGNLEAMLGPDAFEQAAALAAAASIPLAPLERAEPWYAAITVEQMMLMRIGFDPAFGIEAHLASRAAEDRKEIIGLETMREQLELLDGLSLDAQRSLLLQSLEDSLEIGEIMDEMVRAWRHGDLGYLEDTILKEMQTYPELYRALVVARNVAWVEKIDALLNDSDDYLVVVGALHLIGEDGVPTLLGKRGKQAVQLRRTSVR
jgi:hypothetical protein